MFGFIILRGREFRKIEEELILTTKTKDGRMEQKNMIETF
jgi:hypothetical protein